MLSCLDSRLSAHHVNCLIVHAIGIAHLTAGKECEYINQHHRRMLGLQGFFQQIVACGERLTRRAEHIAIVSGFLIEHGRIECILHMRRA